MEERIHQAILRCDLKDLLEQLRHGQRGQDDREEDQRPDQPGRLAKVEDVQQRQHQTDPHLAYGHDDRILHSEKQGLPERRIAEEKGIVVKADELESTNDISLEHCIDERPHNRHQHDERVDEQRRSYKGQHRSAITQHFFHLVTSRSLCT